MNILSIVLMAFWPSLLCLGQVPRDTARGASNPTGTAEVSGVVLEAGGGAPLGRVVVTLTGAGLPIGRSATTDEAGRFSLDHLPPGRFILSPTKPGLLGIAFGASRPGQPGSEISLSEGQTITGVRLSMVRGATIGGTVFDHMGQPAGGAIVAAVRVLPSGEYSRTGSRCYTDERGHYRVFGLVPGEYVISVEWRVSSFGAVFGAPTTAEIDAALAALARRERASAKEPVPSVQSARRAVVPTMFYPGVPEIEQAAKIRLAAGAIREGLDITLRLAQMVELSGTVAAPDGSHPRAALTAASSMTAFPSTGTIVPSASTDADGNFKFTDVAPGKQTLMARTASGPRLWARAELQVGAEGLSGLALTLQPGMSVPGRVVFDGTAPASPSALANVRIAVSTPADEVVLRAGLQGLTVSTTLPPAASVSADGRFELTGLAPGTYQVAINQVPGGWWVRSAVANGKDVLDTPWPVESPSTAGELVVTFTDRQSSLSGTVVASPNTYALTTIVAFPSTRTLWRAPRRVATARPGTDGAYTIRGLPAGEYLVVALLNFDTDEGIGVSLFERLTKSASKVIIGETSPAVVDLKPASLSHADDGSLDDRPAAIVLLQ